MRYTHMLAVKDDHANQPFYYLTLEENAQAPSATRDQVEGDEHRTIPTHFLCEIVIDGSCTRHGNLGGASDLARLPAFEEKALSVVTKRLNNLPRERNAHASYLWSPVRR